MHVFLTKGREAPSFMLQRTPRVPAMDSCFVREFLLQEPHKLSESARDPTVVCFVQERKCYLNRIRNAHQRASGEFASNWGKELSHDLLCGHCPPQYRNRADSPWMFAEQQRQDLYQALDFEGVEKTRATLWNLSKSVLFHLGSLRGPWASKTEMEKRNSDCYRWCKFLQ